MGPSLAELIQEIIKIHNPRIDIQFYEGSPFPEDNNNEYRYKIVNQIQDDAKSENLIIIQNLDKIHPYLYDLYNKNYIVKDEKNYARVCLDDLSEQLTLVNDRFRIIILVDRRFIRKVDMALLQRLEKMIVTFDKLLDNEQKRLTETINNEINLIKYIENYNNMINYSLENLLINYGREDIEGLIYNIYMEIKKKDDIPDEDTIKSYIYNKIYKIIPQDIISIIPVGNKTKRNMVKKNFIT